jgi:hypothetical protein
MSWMRRQSAKTRAQEARDAAVARNQEGMAMVNRSDDYVPVAKPPSEDRVLVTTAWGPMEAWKAKALAVAEVQSALRADEAADKWAEDQEQREAREMHLDPAEDCDACDDCREGEKRDDGKIAKALGVIGKGDEGEPEKPPRALASEDQEPPEDDPPEDDPDDPDPEEMALQRILAELSRLDQRVTALQEARDARLKLDRAVDAEIERQRDQMPPTAEKPLPALPN